MERDRLYGLQSTRHRRNFQTSDSPETFGSMDHALRLRSTFLVDVMAVTVVKLSSFMFSIWHVVWNKLNKRVFFIFLVSVHVSFSTYCTVISLASGWHLVLFPLTSCYMFAISQVIWPYFNLHIIPCKDFFESSSIGFSNIYKMFPFLALCFS